MPTKEDMDEEFGKELLEYQDLVRGLGIELAQYAAMIEPLGGFLSELKEAEAQFIKSMKEAATMPRAD